MNNPPNWELPASQQTPVTFYNPATFSGTPAASTSETYNYNQHSSTNPSWQHSQEQPTSFPTYPQSNVTPHTVSQGDQQHGYYSNEQYSYPPSSMSYPNQPGYYVGSEQQSSYQGQFHKQDFDDRSEAGSQYSQRKKFNEEQTTTDNIPQGDWNEMALDDFEVEEDSTKLEQKQEEHTQNNNGIYNQTSGDFSNIQAGQLVYGTDPSHMTNQHSQESPNSSHSNPQWFSNFAPPFVPTSLSGSGQHSSLSNSQSSFTPVQQHTHSAEDIYKRDPLTSNDSHGRQSHETNPNSLFMPVHHQQQHFPESSFNKEPSVKHDSYDNQIKEEWPQSSFIPPQQSHSGGHHDQHSNSQTAFIPVQPSNHSPKMDSNKEPLIAKDSDENHDHIQKHENSKGSFVPEHESDHKTEISCKTEPSLNEIGKDSTPQDHNVYSNTPQSFPVQKFPSYPSNSQYYVHEQNNPSQPVFLKSSNVAKSVESPPTALPQIFSPRPHPVHSPGSQSTPGFSAHQFEKSSEQDLHTSMKNLSLHKDDSTHSWDKKETKNTSAQNLVQPKKEPSNDSDPWQGHNVPPPAPLNLSAQLPLGNMSGGPPLSYTKPVQEPIKSQPSFQSSQISSGGLHHTSSPISKSHDNRSPMTRTPHRQEVSHGRPIQHQPNMTTVRPSDEVKQLVGDIRSSSSHVAPVHSYSSKPSSIVSDRGNTSFSSTESGMQQGQNAGNKSWMDPFANPGMFYQQGMHGPGSDYGRVDHRPSSRNSIASEVGMSDEYRRREEYYQQWYAYMHSMQSYMQHPYYSQYYANQQQGQGIPNAGTDPISQAANPAMDPYMAYYQSFYNQYSVPGYGQSMEPAGNDRSGRLTPRLYTIPHRNVSLATPGLMIQNVPSRPDEGEPARLEVHWVPTCEEDRLDHANFPGPLGRDMTFKADVRAFLKDKMVEIQDRLPTDWESAALLVAYLDFLVKNNGIAHGDDLADLLLEGHETRTCDLRSRGLPVRMTSMEMLASLPPSEPPSGRTSPSSQHHRPSSVASSVSGAAAALYRQQQQQSVGVGENRDLDDRYLDRFRKLLMYGRKMEALEYACKHDIWGQAFALAHHLNLMHKILTRFLNKAMKMNDPLQTLHQLMSGQVPVSVTSPLSSTASMSGVDWGDWRPHLSMILSTQADSPQLAAESIEKLGDTLMGQHLLYAGQLCYLLAGVNFSDSAGFGGKMLLIGSALPKLKQGDRIDTNVVASNEAIQLTEIYEYAMSLADRNFFLPHLQPYKYLYATRLLDAGMIEQCYRYCYSIARVINRCPANMFGSTLISGVLSLSERLQFHPDCEVAFSSSEWIDQLRSVYDSVRVHSTVVPQHPPIDSINEQEEQSDNILISAYRKDSNPSTSLEQETSGILNYQQQQQQHHQSSDNSGYQPTEATGHQYPPSNVPTFQHQQQPSGPGYQQGANTSGYQNQQPSSGLNYQQPSGPVFQQPGNQTKASSVPVFQQPPSGPGKQQHPSVPEYQQQPPSGPGYQQQPPSGPGYQQQPPSGPGYQQQPPSGPGYQQQPPSGPGYQQQPPSVPGYQQQPPSVPGYQQQPPSVPGFQQQPPSGPGYQQPGGHGNQQQQNQSVLSSQQSSAPGSPGYQQNKGQGNSNNHPPVPMFQPNQQFFNPGTDTTQSTDRTSPSNPDISATTFDYFAGVSNQIAGNRIRTLSGNSASSINERHVSPLSSSIGTGVGAFRSNEANIQSRITPRLSTDSTESNGIISSMTTNKSSCSNDVHRLGQPYTRPSRSRTTSQNSSGPPSRSRQNSTTQDNSLSGPRKNSGPSSQQPSNTSTSGVAQSHRDSSETNNDPNMQQQDGWFSRFFGRKTNGPKEVHLPDDSKPAIVWDPKKGGWVDTTAPEESNQPLAPPPKLPSVNQGRPASGPSIPLASRAPKSRYVNTLAKETTGSSTNPSMGEVLLPPMPGAVGANNFFVPTQPMPQ